jgi:hypothetical protein
MNFTLRDLRKGKREMEKVITTVGRIRRQFSAGRPPKPGNWDTREALRTIAQRLDALLGAMTAEKLGRQDLSAVLVLGEFVQGPDPLNTDHIEDVNALIQFLPLVIKGKSHLSAAVDAVLPNPKKVVIGAVYQILDRETPEPQNRYWATPAFRDVDGTAERVLNEALKRIGTEGISDA